MRKTMRQLLRRPPVWILGLVQLLVLVFNREALGVVDRLPRLLCQFVEIHILHHPFGESKILVVPKAAG